MMNVFYIMSGKYTIIAHACMFSNMGALLIVFYRLMRKLPIHKYELIGVAIAIMGCFLTSNDSKAEKV